MSSDVDVQNLTRSANMRLKQMEASIPFYFKSVINQANTKLDKITMQFMETLNPNASSDDNRCMMPFNHGRSRCPRSFNPADPDRLCNICRKRNNRACLNDKESYFEYWDSDTTDFKYKMPSLKHRGIRKRRNGPTSVSDDNQELTNNLTHSQDAPTLTYNEDAPSPTHNGDDIPGLTNSPLNLRSIAENLPSVDSDSEVVVDDMDTDSNVNTVKITTKDKPNKKARNKKITKRVLPKT